MKFELNSYHRNIPEDALIADLQAVAAKVGKESLASSEYEQHGKYGVTTILRRFGKWNDALKRAGLEIRNLQNISIDDLFGNLEEVWIKLGRQPTPRDIKAKPLSKYSLGTYEKRFKGWRNALEKFVEYMNEDEVSSTEKAIASLPVDKGTKHKTKRQVNQRLRWLVIKRDKFKCRACGKSPATHAGVDLEVDHIKPWSKGGETVMENLQTLCGKCNVGKSNIE